MATVKINSRNQAVVPAEVRKHLKVGPGDELIIVVHGSTAILVAKPANLVKALAGSAKGIYGDVDRYLKRERRSWRRKNPRTH